MERHPVRMVTTQEDGARPLCWRHVALRLRGGEAVSPAPGPANGRPCADCEAGVGIDERKEDERAAG